jgi:U3 small nucleolar RNA-associated protein 21
VYSNIFQQRNKPTEAPKAPEKAPFFLPSLEGGKPTPISASMEESSTTIAERSRIMKMDRLGSEDEFTVVLRAASESQNYEPFTTLLSSLSPSAADLQIRSLSQVNEGGEGSELTAFVEALTYRLRQKRDYELVLAWMSVFLRLHGDAVPMDAELGNVLREWREEQSKEGKRLGDLVGYCGGVVGFLRSPRT